MWQKGNTKTLEHLQDLVLLWNDSALPSKGLCNTDKTFATQHPILLCRQLSLDFKFCIYLSSRSAQKCSKKIEGSELGRIETPPPPPSQGLQARRRLNHSSSVVPLLHPHLCILSEKGLVEQLNLSLARLLPAESPLGKGICCCPSPAKISPSVPMLICSEKFTSKATAALQRGNKLQGSRESVTSPGLATVPANPWRGFGPDCRVIAEQRGKR